MDSKLICYLCCICLLWSCEYKIHENFVDIEKPQDSVNASIDLNAVTDGQTILINKETELNYSLTAFGKDIKGLKFKMGDIVWSDSDLQPNGSLMISSSTFPSGNYTLTCECYSPTGSGSIADQMEIEGYSFKMSWPVIIDYSMELPSIISQGVSADGYLTLNWAEPVLSHLELQSYTITGSSEGYTVDVTVPAGNTSWTDKNNLGAESVYNIRMNLRDGNTTLVWPMGEVKMPDAIRYYIVKADIEETVVAWETPYPADISVRLDDGTVFRPDDGKATVSLPPGEFGSMTTTYNARLVLVSTEDPGKTTFRELQVGSPGIFQYESRGARWVYNRMTGCLYAQEPGSLRCYSTDGELLSSDNRSSGWGVFSSPVSGRVVTDGNPANVFDGRTLALLNSVDCEGYSSLLGINAADELIYCAYRGDGSGAILHFSTLEGEHLAAIPSNALTPQMSVDGKYLMYEDGFDQKLIILNNHQIVADTKMPYSYGTYWKSMLHPVHPDQLLIAYDDYVEVIHLPDFKRIKIIRKDMYAQLVNVDPLTGNLLIYNSNNLKVLSPEGEVLFTLKTASWIYPLLLGNTLLSFDGYILNIEKYLQK